MSPVRVLVSTDISANTFSQISVCKNTFAEGISLVNIHTNKICNEVTEKQTTEMLKQLKLRRKKLSKMFALKFADIAGTKDLV